MNRREFVGAAAAGAGAEADAPVRARPLSSGFWGSQFFDERERAELGEVMETGDLFRFYGRSPQPPAKVATFEREFAARTGTRFALALCTGTAALDTAITALEIGPGDEVIIPAFTFISCYNTVVLAGALPVFAEVNESFNIDPKDVERHITPRTKLIMACHMRGNPADMDPILEIARRRRVRVLEDAAQSMGARYKGRPVGSMGDIGMFSLQVSKPITAGEGGVLSMNEPLLFERAVRYHDVGNVRPPMEKVLGKTQLEGFPGTNLRMSELTGAVALSQIRKLDRICGAVRATARRVYEGIGDLPGLELRQRPDPDGEIGSSVFIGLKSKEQCDRFLAGMKAQNVPAGRPSGGSILPAVPFVMKKIPPRPNWPTFTSERGKAIRYGAEICPRSVEIVSRFAGVSIDPKYTAGDADDIVAAIRKVYARL